jgi:two-component system, chemotaxis family, sensor kinase CheA
MSGPVEGPFVDEFIDDFFAECDEHLATIRRVLLDLEGRPDARRKSLLQELSRALHTVKGLSGMVGLTTAEEVAHAMEDAVRALHADPVVDAALLEVVFAGEKLLEVSIDARRAGAPLVSADDYVARVRSMLSSKDGQRGAARSESTAVATSAAAPVAVIAASAPKRFEFAPSAQLAGRGIGVETIRQRLASLGTITATIPHVRPTGGLVFEFAVAMRDDAAPLEEWRNDGLTWDGEVDHEEVDGVVEPAGPGHSSVASAGSNVVRVDLSRLDDLMRMVGELVVSRARLADALSRVNAKASTAWEDVLESNETIERQLRTMREGVMRIRLIQVGEVFERMRFAMRDIMRETGKNIHLEFAGQETQIDKLVVDRILEPLLHLVRNSASHGIESPEERIARGKPVNGRISLRARAAGDRIILEVEDDGGGIDVDSVSRRANEMGLLTRGESVGPERLLEVLCEPGLTTRESADRASGRGIGMAVVRTTIRGLGGDLFVDSIPGQGTRFTIELPLTLMITDALIVEISDQLMAIPQITLREIIPLDLGVVTRLENNEVMSYRGRVMPLVNLRALFKLTDRPSDKRHVLIVGNDNQQAGLVVDRLIGLREIVVHPIADPLITVPGVAGATELADGRVSLILDAGALVRASRARGAASQPVRLAGELTAGQREESAWA